MPVAIAELTRQRRADLERLGWVVTEVPGRDHMDLPVEVTVQVIREALDEHVW